MSIVNNLSDSSGNKALKTEFAKNLIIFSITKAYVLFRSEQSDIQQMLAEENDGMKKESDKTVEQVLFEEITALDLDKKDIKELEVLMFSYQARAGIKPIQSFKQRARAFEMQRDLLGGD